MLARSLKEVVAPAGPTDLVPAHHHVDLFRLARTRRASWSPDERPLPSPDVAPTSGEHQVLFFASQKPWSIDFTDHQNAGRHATCQTAMPIVVDQKCTPFQAVASIGDATSLVTNWGISGVGFINTDISLALSLGREARIRSKRCRA